MPRHHQSMVRPRPGTNPYFTLVADVIIDALLIAKGERKANDHERRQCLNFLQDEKCRRWCEILGLNWNVIAPQLDELTPPPGPRANYANRQ